MQQTGMPERPERLVSYMDSVPVVAITANVGVTLLGKDSFQEVDIAGVVMPITKHSFIVKNVHELADTIRRAFIIAKTGRPGPVLVDITKDVTANVADFESMTPPEIPRITKTIEEESGLSSLLTRQSVHLSLPEAVLSLPMQNRN